MYLFKYISKRTDKIAAKIVRQVGNPPTDTNNLSIQIDEIHNYIDGRFVCPHEACWRILKYDIHGRQPAVQILSVHLEEWLEYNKLNGDGLHLSYIDFTKEFVWYSDTKSWRQRQRRNAGLIGRLANVYPTSGELFFLCMLLCHQKGCKTFDDIRTVNKRLYPTFRVACEALGLLGDDKEWHTALEEAAFLASSQQLRSLFVQILIFCDVADPMRLWKAFCCRFWAAAIVKKLRDALKNRELMEEKSYNRAELAREIGISVPKLNSDQKAIYDMVLRAANENKQEMIFVYGHGGTGKTFLWKTLINTMRSEGKIVLAVVSSGIASLLLLAGRTAHSRFKLPLDLTDESLCNIKKNTNAALLLAETSLIIWDESHVNDRRCLKALERTLRDVLDDPEKLFGGKTIILRELWPHFKVCKLTENMRLLQPRLNEYERTRATNFASWLLEIGDGKIGTVEENSEGDSSWITVPEEFCIPDDDNGLKNLIGFIYDENTIQHPTAADLQQKAIVCPKNTIADEINETVLEMLHGKSMIYTSSDEAILIGSDRGEVELLYPPEYLNTLQFSGFPSHRLELKVGAPYMLLRNMNLQGGICNGTRMIIKKLWSRLIEADVITGNRFRE
ncbi:DNA helicase [Tanacetum coccineum]